MESCTAILKCTCNFSSKAYPRSLCIVRVLHLKQFFPLPLLMFLILFSTVPNIRYQFSPYVSPNNLSNIAGTDFPLRRLRISFCSPNDLIIMKK